MLDSPHQPKLVVLGDPRPATVTPWGKWEALRGQLWVEWYAHSKLLLFFVAVWLAGVWILPLYANPAWILSFGCLFAIVAGPVYGGSDTVEGCEEFIFALSPTRTQRFFVRILVGGGALLLFTLMDLLALGMDLPQILAKLYVSSGLIQPWPVFRSGLLYGLVLSLPLAIFSFSFVISAITHSRAVTISASFWAALVSLAALRLGFWYEEIAWGKQNGYFACPLLALLAIGVLWGGARAYRRKECGHYRAPIPIPARWWLWILLFLGGLVVALSLAASLAQHFAILFSRN